MIQKYIKKPVEIEAIQWDGTYVGSRKIEMEFPDLNTISKSYHDESDICSHWKIQTLEGSLDVTKGDYVIKGVKGEFYPCKPDIFDLTYEKG